MPPQHGAWAFLGLPIASALPLTPWQPALLLLAVAWVAAYPASYFVLAIVRERRARRPDRARFVPPLLIWSAPVVAAGLPLLVVDPWLAWAVLGYLVAFAINMAFARRRDDRSLVNDIVFVAECSAMVPITWLVGASGGASAIPSTVWIVTLAVALLLTGSTMHVKSLIRERSDPRYATASRVVALLSAAAAVALAAWWGLPAGLLLLLPFAWFAVRSLVLADPSLRPGRIGMIELVGFLLLVLATVAATWWTP